jgi:hypothetical protein
MNLYLKKGISVMFIMLLSIGVFGCSAVDSEEKSLEELNFLVYAGDDQTHWQAKEGELDLQTQEVTVDDEVVYEVIDEHGWSDALYPMEFTDEWLVLRGESSVQPDRDYVICEREDYLGEYKIWNGRLSLTFDPKTKQSLIENGEEIVGTLDNLDYEGISLQPIAFFMDEDKKLVLLCERGSEATAWDDSYPVAVVASLRNSESKSYVIESMRPLENMFSEELSKMKAPYRTWFDTNVYADEKEACFYWNETRCIVKINPYNGAYEVILSEQDVKENMPYLDTTREGYGFFTGFAVQDDMYIVQFTNYNDVFGTYAALFDYKGELIGSLLCTESSLTYQGVDGETISEIKNDDLKGLLYIPSR